MQKSIDKVSPTLKETNSKTIMNNLYTHIIEKASEYLNDENIIGLYVECNAPLKPKSHDSLSISYNKRPYVNLVAVFDKQDSKYKSKGESIRIVTNSGTLYGNYDFSTFFSSIDNYNISHIKGFLASRTSFSLLRGIIMYDKYGILTEAQQKLPSVLNSRLVDAYGELQDIKINKVLSKKLPVIGNSN